MVRVLSLRARFALWTSVTVAASVAGLMLAVSVIASRALRTETEMEMDRIASKTAEELDLWISSRQRDALNLSELAAFGAACAGNNLPDAQQAVARIHSRSPFYENVFLADAGGKLFLDSIGGKSVGFELNSQEDSRVNLQHAQAGEVWMGDVMKSPATGRPVALI